MAQGYWDREDQCQQLFNEGGPFFLITTAHTDFLSFSSEADFITGTNIEALCLVGTNVRILIETIMHTHLHSVAEGHRDEVLTYTESLRRKMHRFQKSRGYELGPDWEIQMLPLDNLKALRNAILYVARNAYLAMPNATPTGYRWCSAYLLFNQIIPYLETGSPFDEISYREKRKVCHSHLIEQVPADFLVRDGMILRSSFVDYRRTEGFFHSANQFFAFLSKRGESDVEVARLTHERIQLPDDEVFSIVSSWFRGRKIRELDLRERLETALRMRRELASGDKQIAQILRIPSDQVKRLLSRSE